MRTRHNHRPRGSPTGLLQKAPTTEAHRQGPPRRMKTKSTQSLAGRCSRQHDSSSPKRGSNNDHPLVSERTEHKGPRAAAPQTQARGARAAARLSLGPADRNSPRGPLQRQDAGSWLPGCGGNGELANGHKGSLQAMETFYNWTVVMATQSENELKIFPLYI